MTEITPSINSRNLFDPKNDDLRAWMQLYFENFDTSSENSRKIKKRAFSAFLKFLESETGNTLKANWTPRFSSLFIKHLKSVMKPGGGRYYSDRTINNNFIPHLKHLAKFIDKFSPWILGNPGETLKRSATANDMDIDRAISTDEKRRLLDLADALPSWAELPREVLSPSQKRIVNKSFRPYRDRAILYTLCVSGMRIGSLTAIEIGGVDFDNRSIKTIVKGDRQATINTSKHCMIAIGEYIELERVEDNIEYDSVNLFLPAKNRHFGKGKLSTRTINAIWCKYREFAMVRGDRTPHSARHRVGIDMTKKAGLGATSSQLSHASTATTILYNRATKEEIQRALEDED